MCDEMTREEVNSTGCRPKVFTSTPKNSLEHNNEVCSADVKLDPGAVQSPPTPTQHRPKHVRSFSDCTDIKTAQLRNAGTPTYDDRSYNETISGFLHLIINISFLKDLKPSISLQM